MENERFAANNAAINYIDISDRTQLHDEGADRRRRRMSKENEPTLINYKFFNNKTIKMEMVIAT